MAPCSRTPRGCFDWGEAPRVPAGGGIAAIRRPPQGPPRKKTRDRMPPGGGDRSAFLIRGDVAVDKVGDIVVVFLFPLKEGDFRGGVGPALAVDIVDRRFGGPLPHRLDFV